jgi:hypothetical protein
MIRQSAYKLNSLQTFVYIDEVSSLAACVLHVSLPSCSVHIPRLPPTLRIRGRNQCERNNFWVRACIRELISRKYRIMLALNRNCPKPLYHLRRGRLFTPQHPPEIGTVDPQQLRKLAPTPHQAQKLSQLLKPSLVYRRDGLGFMTQLLHRPNQPGQRFVRYWHAFAQIPQGVGGHPSPAKQCPISDLAHLFRLGNECRQLGVIPGGERVFEQTSFLPDVLAFLDLVGLLPNR